MFRQVHSHVDSNYSANRAVRLKVCPLPPAASARDVLSALTLNAASVPGDTRGGF